MAMNLVELCECVFIPTTELISNACCATFKPLWSEFCLGMNPFLLENVSWKPVAGPASKGVLFGYFFVPLHDGWHFTNVNNQPLLARVLFVLPFWELLFVTSWLGSQFPLSDHQMAQPPSAFLCSCPWCSFYSTQDINTFIVWLYSYSS